MDIVLTDFNTRTIFSARRIKADAGYSRGIVALQRLIALILLMRADSKITLSIVQRIQTDMIDLVCADVAAGVDSQRIGDLHALAVDHAGLFLTGGVDEIAVCIGGILRAIHIAVAQGQLQIGRDFSAPLRHALLPGLFNGFPDFPDGHGIALGNDEGSAVLGLAAVDALGFENVNEGHANLAGDDFDGHSVFPFLPHRAFNLICTCCAKMLLIIAANDYSLKSPAASEYGLRG